MSSGALCPALRSSTAKASKYRCTTQRLPTPSTRPTGCNTEHMTTHPVSPQTPLPHHCLVPLRCSAAKLELQVLKKVPTITIDKTDGVEVFLSSDSLDVEIVTAKSSEMNVSVPGANPDNDLVPRLSSRSTAPHSAARPSPQLSLQCHCVDPCARWVLPRWSTPSLSSSKLVSTRQRAASLPKSKSTISLYCPRQHPPTKRSKRRPQAAFCVG